MIRRPARHLVVFVKEPRPGRVKTRLARAIGTVGAAWWFRRQTRALLRRLAADRRWRTVLAVSPDREGVLSRVWPVGLPRLPQGPGDLGDRMARVVRRMPPGPVLIVGADIPGVRPRHVEDAFRMLGTHDAVFGPSPDGGFWLAGFRRGGWAIPSGLFKGVAWSGPRALADTVAGLRGLKIGYAAVLRDVDEAEDLEDLE